MANNKENNPSAFRAPSSSSKLAKSTKDLVIRGGPKPTGAIKYATHNSIDNVVTGGCSTCGSLHHATVKCDRKDAPSEYLMSGALQPDVECSTTASVTDSAAATPAAKGAQGNGGKRPGQGAGRRHSA